MHRSLLSVLVIAACTTEMDQGVNSQEVALKTWEFRTQAELASAKVAAGCPKPDDGLCDVIAPTAQLGLNLIFDKLCDHKDPTTGRCIQAQGYPEANAAKPVLATCASDDMGGAQCAVDTSPMMMVDTERRRNGVSCGGWSACYFQPRPRGCERVRDRLCCVTVCVPFTDLCSTQCRYEEASCCS